MKHVQGDIKDSIILYIHRHALPGEDVMSATYRIIGEWQSAKGDYDAVVDELRRVRGLLETERLRTKAHRDEQSYEKGASEDARDEIAKLREGLGHAIQFQRWLLNQANF